MAQKDLPSVLVSIKTKGGHAVENVKMSTVIPRGGTLRRRTVRPRKQADVYRIKMPQGTYPFLVSARFFLEEGDFLLFEKGILRRKQFKLEMKKKAAFRSFEELSRKVQGIFERSAVRAGADSAQRYYRKLGPVSKAAALNILAKMAHTPVIKRHKVIDYVDHIYKYRPDRIFLRLTNKKSLLEDIRFARERKRQPIFTPASGALHDGFEAASFKTREEDQRGNLQLSFSSEGKTNVNVDADIDIYTDLLRHAFGEVFWNSLTGLTTSPFKVYQVLTEEDVQPEYLLA